MDIGIIARVKQNYKYHIDFEMIKKSGFTHIDYQEFLPPSSFLYSLNDEELHKYMDELRLEATKYGLIFNQVHSMWHWPIQNFDDKEHLFTSTMRYYVQAIKGTSYLGVKYLVIHHRIPFEFSELLSKNSQARDINISFLRTLIDISKEYNVILCLENLPFDNPYMQFEDTIKTVKEINSPYLGICLDTGHFNLFNNGYSISDAVEMMGEKLMVLHCHDNYKDKDSHKFPGNGTFDWRSFIKALKNINFKGVFSLETVSENENWDEELKENIKLYNIAKSIVDID